MKKRMIIGLLSFVAICFMTVNVVAADVVFAFDNVSGKPGQTVELELTMENDQAVTAVGLAELEYDKENLAFEGFTDYGQLAIDSIVGTLGFDEDKAAVTLGFLNEKIVSGKVCHLVFSIRDNADSGDYAVSMQAKVKNGTHEISVQSPIGTITIINDRSETQGQPDHTHEMTQFAAKEPNCFEQGNIEFWKCKICGRNYLDSFGDKEIINVSLPIDSTRHDGKTYVIGVIEANEEHNGYSGDVYCKRCGALLNKGEIIKWKFEEIRYSDAAKDSITKTDQGWDNPFIDVKEEDEYYQAVRFVYENGLFKGISETEFSPNTTMTRAMFVTVLGRLENVDVESFVGKVFDDVPLNMWYSPYVEWANENGIVKGYNEKTFGTNDEITIEQAVVILARYAGFRGVDYDTHQDLTGYPDGEDVSSWAVSEMMWASEKGIYCGKNGNLNPHQPASRAEVAEMLNRFVEHVM